ncbi:hypothetical protein J6590_003074 [Homalodisca vitripennis]|nr:hypothetical protein J6590_003074 [Homalodisca vitripennis]
MFSDVMHTPSESVLFSYNFLQKYLNLSRLYAKKLVVEMLLLSPPPHTITTTTFLLIPSPSPPTHSLPLLLSSSPGI